MTVGNVVPDRVGIEIIVAERSVMVVLSSPSEPEDGSSGLELPAPPHLPAEAQDSELTEITRNGSSLAVPGS